MDCTKCEISKSCISCQMGTGKKTAKVMFVADNPTEFENSKGEWMIGSAGKVFRDLLTSIGLDIKKDCYFTGVVKCPTPEDDKGNQRQPLRDEINNCAPYLAAEMKIVNPDIIVPMGNVALKAVFGKTGITNYRGKAVEKDDKIVFPILHPSQIFKQPKHTKNFTTDIMNLKELIEKGNKYFAKSEVDYRYLETLEEVTEEIERLEREAEWLVFDIETTGLDAFRKESKVICISLTDRDHYGVTIPLEHKSFTWPSGIFEKVVDLIKRLLENKRIKKMGHNGKFDMKWLMYQYGIDVANYKFDPMIAHYIAVSEERKGHGLKDLAWEHTDMGGYDNELDEYKQENGIVGNYGDIEWEILREYAAADVDCTMRLFKVFEPMISNHPKWPDLFQLYMDGSYALRDLELNGAMVNKERAEEFNKAYLKRIAELEEQLRQFPEVIQIEREKQKLFELRQLEMKKPKDERDPVIVKYNKYKNFKFSFGSTAQLRELFFEKLGLDTPFKTDKGELSTGKETLAYLEDKHPIAKLMVEWRKLAKLHGTYIKPANEEWICEDGLIHGTFNLVGTVTSRLASDSPNLQNIPRKSNTPTEFQYKYGPKKLFTSRFGDEGIMLQFDYCLTGDTLIRTAYQGDITIKEIVERVNKGEAIYVYSCNPETNEIVVSKVEKGMLTFKNKEVFNVYLDNGEVVKATAEHPFMLRDGSYKQVKDLQPNMSLMGFREYIRTDSETEVDYRYIGVDYQNRRLEHRVIAEYFNDSIEGLVVHHDDENGLNNNPNNLKPMTQGEHWRLHQQRRWSKMTPEERSEFIKSQDRFSDKTRKKLSENAKNMWATFTDKEYEEICRKLSESADNKGEKNPMFDKKHKESTRVLISERQKAYQNKLSPEKRKENARRMTRAKLKKVADAIIADGEKINSKTWEEYKKKVSSRAPKWHNAYEELVLMNLIENHKVVLVLPAGKEDVYDIKVENFSNFALSAGVFVHNSQLELRVAGIFSQDEGLMSAYKSGKDLHRFVASRVHKIPEEEVSSDQRTAAKAVGFGLLYGKGSRSLAQDMGVSLDEAEEFIEAYFKEFPGMRKWIESTKKKVKKDKYVETLTGFRRRLPAVDSNDRGIQSDAMRQAINSPIQGTGGSMTLKSIVLINKMFKQKNLKSKLCITVHDSIVADTYIPEFEIVFKIMKTVMENLPFPWISIPIVAEAEVGRDYGTMVEIGSLDELKEYNNNIFDFVDAKVIEKKKKDYEKAGLEYHE